MNGVLRSLCAGKDAIRWPDREREPFSFLSVRYSMPEWIVRKWAAEYGENRTEAMLAALLEKRPLTIRLAERLDGKARILLLEQLKQGGFAPKPHPLFAESGQPAVYTLSSAEGVAGLPGFSEGAFAVQDAASMLPVECSGLRKLAENGERRLFVLDVCAAPAGRPARRRICWKTPAWCLPGT